MRRVRWRRRGSAAGPRFARRRGNPAEATLKAALAQINARRLKSFKELSLFLSFYRATAPRAGPIAGGRGCARDDAGSCGRRILRVQQAWAILL
jgi:hypothetical protein